MVCHVRPSIMYFALPKFNRNAVTGSRNTRAFGSAEPINQLWWWSATRNIFHMRAESHILGLYGRARAHNDHNGANYKVFFFFFSDGLYLFPHGCWFNVRHDMKTNCEKLWKFLWVSVSPQSVLIIIQRLKWPKWLTETICQKPMK